MAAASECGEPLLVGSALGFVNDEAVDEEEVDVLLVVLAASDDITAAAAAAADVRAATAATDAITPSKLLTELFSRLLEAAAETAGGFGLVPLFNLRSNSDVESGATCCCR